MKIKNNILFNVCNEDVVNGTITIPNNVTGIAHWAFYNCKGLTSVIIPEGMEIIGFGAFRGCSSLTSITIPDSVRSIHEDAFYDCKGLTNVVIGNGLTSIGSYAFCGCNELTNITIPDSVIRIGTGAFCNCKKLTSITIPNGMKSIEIGMFSGCRELTSITIPDSVTKIRASAFSGCIGLTTKIKAYKAFRITTNGEFSCLGKIYKPEKLNYVRGELELCSKGIHYCTNLFEIFDYYPGEIDQNIAIFEIKPGKRVLKSDTSKCCTNSCRLVKRLYREDVIRILNEGGK